MIEFRCSQCGEALEAPDSMAGEKLQCPKCRFPEKIPESHEGPPPIKLESNDVKDDPLSQITTFGSTLDHDVDREYKRPLNQTGQGATRTRTFHTRLSHKAMMFLDEQINEWVDQHPDIEIKFTNTTVGMVEGKKTEPHLIVTVWY